jgi:hypothetical protein
MNVRAEFAVLRGHSATANRTCSSRSTPKLSKAKGQTPGSHNMPDVHKTEIAVSLDRSGSMIGIKQEGTQWV